MIFRENYNHARDLELVDEALNGSKHALSALIKNNQDYIFNIALKLFLQPEDAMDATQEVLIKVITNLKSFRKESQFRTWLYRITVNHFLSIKNKKIETIMSNTPQELKESHAIEPEEKSLLDENLVEEVRLLCSTAMLMCLEREQRLIYIIGEIFGADHKLGAELFDTTPGNYRIKLHRAKAQLLNFVSNKCGLINPINSCRCPKKTRQFVKAGIVDKENIQFNKEYSQKINQLVDERKDEVNDVIQLKLKDFFQDSPFQIKTELDKMLSELIA